MTDAERLRDQNLLEWAKKAREELNNHRSYVIGEGGEYPEDWNDEDVIELCDEYDKIVGIK